jgi:hypothetical protein
MEERPHPTLISPGCGPLPFPPLPLTREAITPTAAAIPVAAAVGSANSGVLLLRYLFGAASGGFVPLFGVDVSLGDGSACYLS